MSPTPRPAFDKPLETTPIDGEVAITGPGHVHGSFTPEAARASAERLLRDADAAGSQAESVDEADAESPAEPEA